MKKQRNLGNTTAIENTPQETIAERNAMLNRYIELFELEQRRANQLQAEVEILRAALDNERLNYRNLILSCCNAHND